MIEKKVFYLPFIFAQTQEEMLRERLRTIEEMERHYDELQVEKRKVRYVFVFGSSE